MRPDERSADQALQAMVKRVAEIFADNVIERLRPELSGLLHERQFTASMRSQDRPATPGPRGSLWSVNDIAKDSGTSPSTWRKWILERRIPVVRLGRAIRIKDSDYQRLIADGVTPELRWEKRAGPFR